MKTKKTQFRVILLIILAAVLSLTLAACIPTPTPTVVIPPTATLAPTPIPVPTPRCSTWLLDIKTDKAAVFVATGYNDSGAPIIGINTGVVFELGTRLEYCYPCPIADGGDSWCEIHRSIDGAIWPAGRYVRRDKLSRVY